MLESNLVSFVASLGAMLLVDRLVYFKQAAPQHPFPLRLIRYLALALGIAGAHWLVAGSPQDGRVQQHPALVTAAFVAFSSAIAELVIWRSKFRGAR